MTPDRVCQAPGCRRPALYRGPDLCASHESKRKRAGGSPRTDRDGSRSHMWRGDRIGYQAAHDRVWFVYGPARLRPCVVPGCLEVGAQWAVQPGAALLLEAPAYGSLYSPEPSDYRPMCHTHHSHLDTTWRHARLALAVDPLELLPGLAVPSLVRMPQGYLHLPMPARSWGAA